MKTQGDINRVDSMLFNVKRDKLVELGVQIKNI